MSSRTPQTFSLGIILLLLAATSTWADEARNDRTVDEFRLKLRKWVEARQLVSKEASDWLVDQDYLVATRDLLRDERDALRATIAELEANQTGSGEERVTLILERGELQRSSRQLENELRELERQVLRVIPQLPAPLTKRLEPLLVQIPEQPEAATGALAQRLMNVLGVLAQTEKFNATATLVGETRAIVGDQKVQVRTLYWGLAQAVSVDAQRRMAGVGRPSADGWKFVNDETLAKEAGRLLDIYEGNIDEIAFVPIPVVVR